MHSYNIHLGWVNQATVLTTETYANKIIQNTYW